MGVWNLGSVAEAVWDYVDTMPTNTSGALAEIANRQLPTITRWNGAVVGSNNITEKYQNFVLWSTLAEIYCIKADVGADQEQIKLGDFQVKKGSTSSASSLCDKWNAKAETALYMLGINTGFKQVFG